ncbi:plasma-membrane choline transporter-domain-containing protein [Zychaea mexicana]|uniref:plasma-membrane choline transporter-domain-containing protein n=1 Tax=Zychaea mexicana TaxID=64656 RepID=UPI0022FF3362|nr:plasma-membrane choline transporter-domain-containing protein [Zychaea mexicana]KAI9497188.1 plasma-membrane choline transporter-domain-containing protein [Zychaea mexicana]
MDNSVPEFAKSVYSAIKDSIQQTRGFRAAYARMDQESDDEQDDRELSHSLFYSVQQNRGIDIAVGEESIPLTDSHAYSDRSQLLFDQQVDSYEEEENVNNGDNELPRPIHFSDYEESPKPSAIYLETPPTDVAGPSTLPNPKSLSESLLPTVSAIPQGITTVKTERKLRDPFFAALYCLSLLVFIVSGIIIACTTNSHAIENYARGTTFKTISDSAGIMAIMVTSALVCGTLWIYILRTFTKPIVWGTVVIVPVSLLSMFIWTIVESRQRPNIDGGLTALSFIPLVSALIFIKMIHSSQQQISKTIAVLELACDVLHHNPGVFIISVLLLVIFIAFTAIWMVLFNRLWLIGHLNSGSTAWVVSDNAYFLACFYLFVYLWTAAILSNMQRFALSAVTAQWYFHRHEPAKSHQDKAWKNALVRAAASSLGTIALGSLILTIVQTLQLFTQYIRKNFKQSWPLMSIISLILGYIEALINQINHYTISLAGITGESFYSSARSSTKIFRRNLLSGLVGDLLTKMILYIGSLVVALSSGFAAYIFATHSLRSSHGFIVGALATIVPLYVSRFFSYTMMSIVDATFLCYAIDLDTGMVHMSAAHNIFSGFE